MSGLILHPAMTAVQVASFCARHQCSVEVEVIGTRMRIRAVPIEADTAALAFYRCGVCSWWGPEPRWVAMEEPPDACLAGGEVPCCPQCCEFSIIAEGARK